MGTVTGQEIVDQVQTILQDESGVRWPADSELLDWINAGQREAVGINVSAKTGTSVVSMVSGTRQVLPDDAIKLIDVTRNMGADGTAPGRAVRVLERRVLDEQHPDWHSDTPTVSAKHYTHDARDPKAFFVYPPNDGTGNVEAVYSAAPASLSVLTDTIDLDDIYANALVNYVMFRALSKDAEYTANSDAASYYFKSFQEFVTHRAKVDGNTAPGASNDQRGG